MLESIFPSNALQSAALQWHFPSCFGAVITHSLQSQVERAWWPQPQAAGILVMTMHISNPSTAAMLLPGSEAEQELWLLGQAIVSGQRSLQGPFPWTAIQP